MIYKMILLVLPWIQGVTMSNTSCYTVIFLSTFPIIIVGYMNYCHM